MRVSVELVPDEDGRLEGRILTEDGRPDLTFSGTLDLLRALEELQHADRDRGTPSRALPPSPDHNPERSHHVDDPPYQH
jgi:hypothetical protein